VDTGSRQENTSKSESGARFRFHRNGNGSGPRLAARLSVIAVLAALTAGCFHPMYAEHTDGSPALRDKLMGVELLPIDKPNASRDARIGVEIRNALAFKLYGGATGAPPTHQLRIRFSTTRSSLMLDPNTALPSNESYGIDASYQLIEVATGKTVLNANTFARTSYDIPGQFQRFARSRAYRDAEDRAAQQIADNINTRLASFFYSGM
jgi:LPS-assembly lipoprotein